MADKEVAIKISVETEGGAKSLSELKKQFKETQTELEGLDTSSKKYVQTLEKLGGIKDEIGDLNAEINAFNPEGKIQAFGNVVGGLASGFQAAQGAAALFGAEGEALQQTLLKVQAASALADGIKGVMGMGDAFKVLGNVIKANPLMLIASVIIGIGVALFELKDKIKIIGDTFDAITGTINKGIDALKSFSDWLGITSFKTDELAAKQIKLAETVGKATEDRYNKEIERAKAAGQETIDIEIKKQAAIVASLKLQHKDFAQAQEDLLLLVIQRNTKIKAENEKAYLDRKAQLQKEVDALKAANKEVELVRSIDLLDTTDKEKAKTAAFEEGLMNKFNRNIQVNDELEAKQAERDAKELEMQKMNQEASWELTRSFAESTKALIDIGFAYQINQAKGNQKKELELKKKQFKINKAFALSMSIIDGVGSIMKALNNPYPLNIVLAIAAGVAATANTAKIAMTKFEGGETSAGGGGGDLGAAGGGVALSPPTQGSTSLNADGTVKKAVEQKQPMIKAVVTETDITKTQKKVNTIEEQSKF